MTIAEINAMFEDIKIDDVVVPYAYYQFPETGQQPPFICWYCDGIDDVYGDNSNYQRIVQLIIEFYSDEKDFATESTIEAVLKQHGLSYGMTETYIDTERMHQTVYSMEVLING